MHLILTGATGLVGSAVLDSMIRSKDITKISILSRKPVDMAANSMDERINVIIHRDFQVYDPKVLDQLKGADACVWALGISQAKVSKEEYVKITKVYTLAAARSFANLSPSNKRPFRFIYVSGEGATHTPGRFSALFARTKGETEQALVQLTTEISTLEADSVRLGFVDSRDHMAIQPYIPDPGLVYRIAIVVTMPLMKTCFKGMHSPTTALGSFLTEMAKGHLDFQLEGKGVFKMQSSWIVENIGIRRIMDL